MKGLVENTTVFIAARVPGSNGCRVKVDATVSEVKEEKTCRSTWRGCGQKNPGGSAALWRHPGHAHPEGDVYGTEDEAARTERSNNKAKALAGHFVVRQGKPLSPCQKIPSGRECADPGLPMRFWKDPIIRWEPRIDPYEESRYHVGVGPQGKWVLSGGRPKLQIGNGESSGPSVPPPIQPSSQNDSRPSSAYEDADALAVRSLTRGRISTMSGGRSSMADANMAERMTLVMPVSQEPQVLGPGAKSAGRQSKAGKFIDSMKTMGAKRSTKKSLVSFNRASAVPASRMSQDQWDIDEILENEPEDFKKDHYPLKRVAGPCAPDEVTARKEDNTGKLRRPPQRHQGQKDHRHSEDSKSTHANQLVSVTQSEAASLFSADPGADPGETTLAVASTNVGPKKIHVSKENRARKSMRRLREKLVESDWAAFGPQMLSMFGTQDEDRHMAEKKHKLSIAKHIAKQIFTTRVKLQLHEQSKKKGSFESWQRHNTHFKGRGGIFKGPNPKGVAESSVTSFLQNVVDEDDDESANFDDSSSCTDDDE